MKLNVAREALIKDVGKIGAILLLIGLIAGYSFYNRQSTESELAKLDRDTALSKNRIVKLEEENNEFVRLFLRYSKIPNNKREVNLNDLPSRIALLQPVLQNLKMKYHLAQLDISLTNVAPLGTIYDRKRYTTMFNNATFNFGALSDELVLSFLTELFEAMPGFVRVEVFEITRTQEITPSVLGQIQSKKIPVLVTGRVVFSWKTIRAK